MTTETTVRVFAGIDVGAKALVSVIRKNAVSMKTQTFANTPAERLRLVKRLSTFPGITVCLEATGVYSFDIALALTDAGIRVSVLNPKASHNFAKVLRRHSKTDAVDADTLAQYAERMPYQAWARPTDAALALRALARRINTLTRNKAAAKNQRHALTFSPETASAVLLDVARPSRSWKSALRTSPRRPLSSSRHTHCWHAATPCCAPSRVSARPAPSPCWAN